MIYIPPCLTSGSALPGKAKHQKTKSAYFHSNALLSYCFSRIQPVAYFLTKFLGHDQSLHTVGLCLAERKSNRRGK